MKTFSVRFATPEDRAEWLEMRLALWPHHTRQELLSEMDEILANSAAQPVFIALGAGDQPCGFLEGGTRKYADGCDTSPVGYIEGWFVKADFRRQGVGEALVRSMEDWVRAQGLLEIASDTWLDNETSILAHKKLGFLEKEKLVHFAKKL